MGVGGMRVRVVMGCEVPMVDTQTYTHTHTHMQPIETHVIASSPNSPVYYNTSQAIRIEIKQ